jgi:uncharacterized protein (DUF433 family)
MSTVSNPYIEINADGDARIRGTGFKVRILAEEYLNGATPEDMRQCHPPLTLGQVHGALAYYYDHKQQFDEEIAELNRFVEELREQQGESPLATKLREMGRELP